MGCLGYQAALLRLPGFAILSVSGVIRYEDVLFNDHLRGKIVTSRGFSGLVTVVIY